MFLVVEETVLHPFFALIQVACVIKFTSNDSKRTQREVYVFVCTLVRIQSAINAGFKAALSDDPRILSIGLCSAGTVGSPIGTRLCSRVL